MTEAGQRGGLHQACVAIATANVLHPYGLHPRITYRGIDGRPGCLIFPSRDAPRWAHRAGGPLFQLGTAVAEYRRPVRIAGTSYPLMEIDADPGHMTAIVNSVHLHH